MPGAAWKVGRMAEVDLEVALEVPPAPRSSPKPAAREISRRLSSVQSACSAKLPGATVACPLIAAVPETKMSGFPSQVATVARGEARRAGAVFGRIAVGRQLFGILEVAGAVPATVTKIAAPGNRRGSHGGGGGQRAGILGAIGGLEGAGPSGVEGAVVFRPVPVSVDLRHVIPDPAERPALRGRQETPVEFAACDRRIAVHGLERPAHPQVARGEHPESLLLPQWLGGGKEAFRGRVPSQPNQRKAQGGPAPRRRRARPGGASNSTSRGSRPVRVAEAMDIKELR